MRTLLVLLALGALAFPAHATGACYTTSTSDERNTIVEIPVEGPFFGGNPSYLVLTHWDPLTPGNLGGCATCIYTYEETNGIPGLQRQDAFRNDVASCTDGTVADKFPDMSWMNPL